jgi:DNA-binding MarR family transcriptional regulator
MAAPRRDSARPTGNDLRAAIQRFVRTFGLLTADQTPCGQPLAPSYAHGLMVLLDRERLGSTTSQQDLVQVLGIDKSNVARMCAQMSAKGHVLQRDAEHDGRAWSLELTPAGRRLAGRVEESSRGRFDRILQALPSPAARASVLRSLELLNEAIVATHAQEAT